MTSVKDHLDLVVADDQTVFLDGLTAILTQLGHRVLATVNSHVALRAAARALHPDVCILELGLRDGGGPDELARLVTEVPEPHVVVLTADPDPRVMQLALAAGASGYVHKTRGVGVLVDVLQRVHRGEIVIEGSFIRPTARPDTPPARLLHVLNLLTPREWECLARLTYGHDTARMAAELGVSTTTVRSHVQSILTKLGVHSRLEAASLAARYHLIRHEVAEGMNPAS